MGFGDFFRDLFRRRKIDSEERDFMEKAEMIEPEGPLNYNNDKDEFFVNEEEVSLS